MSDYSEFMDGVLYRVEACNGAKHLLWERHAEEAGGEVPWESQDGYLVFLGKVEGLPVYLSVRMTLIYGQKVVFWFGSGRMVDHRLIEAWFETYMGPRRPGNHSDVMNFNNVLSRCREAAGLEGE